METRLLSPEEKKITTPESVEMMQSMVKHAQTAIQRGTANWLMYWGCVNAFTALLNFALLYVLKNPLYAYGVWILIIPYIAINVVMDIKLIKPPVIRSHIDSIVTSIWTAYDYALIIFVIVITGFAWYWNFSLFAILSPVVLLCAGVAQYVTAQVLQFKAYLRGAVIMWIGSIACMLVAVLLSPEYQLLVLPCSMLLGFTWTGYSLKKHVKKN